MQHCNLLRWLFISALLICLNLSIGISPAYSQSATATLSGSIEDQNGAVVAGVSITVQNTATSLERQTTTNSEGSFTLPLLPPGMYIVTARRDGFTPAEIRDVVLNVGDQRSLQIQLKVGQIGGDTVNVSSDPSLIDENPAVGTVINRQFVENLPLNGRSFQSLFELTPGVVLTKTNGTEMGQFSVNGQRANTNYFMVDGVSANIGIGANTTLDESGSGSLPGFSVFGGTSNLVSVDALQEFKIQTSTFAPEFGRSPGAQVSIVTRAGTSQFHGAVFDYLRNDALDAADWFVNNRRLRKPPLRQNDFGAVVGGPIIKQKTFFFFSYEGLRLRQPKVGISDVPTLQARQVAPAGIQPFLNAYPLPNGKDKGNNAAEFSASYSDPSTLNSTSIRIDQVIGNSLTVFGRFSDAPSRADVRGEGRSLSSVNHLESVTQTFTAGATWLISSKINNDLRGNWSRSTGTTRSFLDNFGGAVAPPESLLFPSFAPAEDSLFAFLPLGPLNTNLFSGKNASNKQRQINIVDSLSIMTGPHSLKFGFDYRRIYPIFDILRYQVAPIFFNGFAGTLTGVADLISLASDAGPRYPVFNNYSAFAQDTWKINERLTLTYGLRWDINPPPSESKGNLPVALTGVDSSETLALAPRGTPLFKITYNNFAPRVGISYRLQSRQGRETVLRGGWGIFYDIGAGQASNAFARFPYLVNGSVFGVPFPLDPNRIAPPQVNLTPPITSNINATDPNLKLPRTYQWSAAVEQSVGPNQTFTASYVGAAGRRLIRQEIISNQNFSRVFLTKNRATSDYHAMQLQFDRRLSRGLQALASYTWSHSIDIASADSANNLPVGQVDPKQDRGPSDFDVRHSFTTALTYNIPHVSNNRFVSGLTNNWATDLIFRARSAQPVNVVTGVALFGAAFPPVGRPDLVPGVPLYIEDLSLPGGRKINRAAFAIPPLNRQGTLGRNVLRGFGVSQLDFTLRRQFNLTERVNLQFRAEFFNLLNHPNFGDPGFGLSNTNALNNPNFGLSTATLAQSLGGGGLNGGFNALYQIGGPRSIQLSLKAQF